MVKVLTNYVQKINKIKNGLENQASVIINQNEQEILDYNRKDQLFNKGVDSKGKKLSPYSESSKALKRKLGLPTNRKTHFQTGKHYENFYAKAKKDSLIISAKTKTSKGFDLGKHLNDSEGGNVYGLTESNNQKVNDEILLPKLLEWTLNQMKL